MASLLSFLGDVGKKLHGVEAQLNPFDGGQNYNTVVNNAPVQRPQPQQPAQQAPQPRQTGFGVSPSAPRLPSFNAPQAPKILSPQAQQQWVKTNAMQTQAPPQVSADYAKAAGQVIGAVGDFGKGAIDNVVNSAKTVGNAYASGINYGANQLNGTNDAQLKEIAQRTFMANQLTKSTNNQVMSPQAKANIMAQAQGQMNIAKSLQNNRNQQFQDVQTNNDPLKVAAASANILGTVALPGAGKITEAVGAPITKALMPVAIKPAANIIGKVIGGAAEGGIAGAGFGAAGQLQQTGMNTNQNDLFNSTIQGAKMGAVLGGATPVVMGAVPVVAKGLTKAADATGAKLTEPVAKVAEQASGLPRVNVLNDNEAHTLADYADMANRRWNAPNEVRNKVVMQARNAAKTAGFDITNMSPSEADHTIANYLQARDNYNSAYGTAQKQMMQGGYAKVPGKEPNSLRTGGQVNNQDHVNSSSAKNQMPQPTQTSMSGAKLPQQAQQSQGKVQMSAEPSSASVEPASPLQGNVETSLSQKKQAAQEQQRIQQMQAQGLTEGAHLAQNPKYDSYNNTTTNSLTAKAKRQSLSDDVLKQLNATHEIRNTKELASSVEHITNKMSDKQLLDEAHRVAAVQTGTIDDAGVALVHKAIERADSKGNVREAVSLHDQLSAHLTKKGQEIQAASLLYNLTPQGRLYKATRDLSKAGVDVTSDKGIKLIENLKAQTEAIKKATGDEKSMLTAKFLKTVADNIPRGVADNAISVWKAGLLSGVKTHGGNFVSNGTFAALHDISNPLAVGIDKLISLKTGQRTRSLTATGRISGAGVGIKKGVNTLKTGIDERSIQGNKYDIHGEINFKNPIVQKVFGMPSNAVFRAMGAGDQPFYYSQLKNSLYDMGKADGINQGLKGQALRDYAKGIVENPTEMILNKATYEAQQSVLGQDNKLASNIQRTLNNSGAVGKAGQVIAPFIKVPTNFLGRTLDFTPVVGHAKGIVKAISDVKSGKGLDQRQFSQAMSEATTGGAVVVLGSALAGAKLLSGDYPKNDQKEAQRWKAEGITPNSVKIGNTWYSLNYLGPIGMLLGMGKNYHDAGGGNLLDFSKAGQNANASLQAGSGVGSSLMQQSFLTGFSGFSNALNDPQRQAKSFVSSQASSVVPNWLNDVANRLDSKQRDTSSNSLPQYVGNSVESKIPFARRNLPVKQDVYGNKLDQQASPNNKLLNPLKPSNALTNDVKSEVSRLHNVDAGNKDLQVTPTPIDNTLTLKGGKVSLNDKQKYELQGMVGQNTQTAWSQLIKTPAYKALDDTGKAAALNSLKTDVAATTSAIYAKDNNLGDKKLTAKQQAMAGNQVNLDSYTTTKSAGGISVISPKLDNTNKGIIDKYNAMSAADKTKTFKTDSAAEYQYNQAKYANDKANGSVSDIQDITRQKTLAKDKVGSVFPKDVRDLYGMSKAEINTYLTTDDGKTDKKKMGDQLIAYDKALKDAGLSSTLKFKTGIAPAAKGGGKGKKAAKSKAPIGLAAAMSASNSMKVPKVTGYTGGSKSIVAAAGYKKAPLRTYSAGSSIPKAPAVRVRKGIA